MSADQGAGTAQLSRVLESGVCSSIFSALLGARRRDVVGFLEEGERGLFAYQMFDKLLITRNQGLWALKHVEK